MTLMTRCIWLLRDCRSEITWPPCSAADWLTELICHTRFPIWSPRVPAAAQISSLPLSLMSKSGSQSSSSGGVMVVLSRATPRR